MILTLSELSTGAAARPDQAPAPRSYPGARAHRRRAAAVDPHTGARAAGQRDHGATGVRGPRARRAGPLASGKGVLRHGHSGATQTASGGGAVRRRARPRCSPRRGPTAWRAPGCAPCSSARCARKEMDDERQRRNSRLFGAGPRQALPRLHPGADRPRAAAGGRARAGRPQRRREDDDAALSRRPAGVRRGSCRGVRSAQRLATTWRGGATSAWSARSTGSMCTGPPPRTSKVVASFQPSYSHERVRRMAERFALPLDRKVEELSRGNRAKLAIVAALAHAPAPAAARRAHRRPRPGRAGGRARRALGAARGRRARDLLLDPRALRHRPPRRRAGVPLRRQGAAAQRQGRPGRRLAAHLVPPRGRRRRRAAGGRRAPAGARRSTRSRAATTRRRSRRCARSEPESIEVARLSIDEIAVEILRSKGVDRVAAR